MRIMLFPMASFCNCIFQYCTILNYVKEMKTKEISILDTVKNLASYFSNFKTAKRLFRHTDLLVRG